MKGSSAVSRPGSLVCPLCEVDQFRPSGNDSAQCASCAGLVSGAILVTLPEIVEDHIERFRDPGLESAYARRKREARQAIEEA